MTQEDRQPITFAVPGAVGLPPGAAPRDAAASALPGCVKASVRVTAQPAGATPVRLTAVPGEDIVALHVAGGPVLFLHPATARDLLQGPGPAARGGSDVAVPRALAWPGTAGDAADAAARGLASTGQVLLSGLQILTGLIGDPAADFAASRVVRLLDAQVDPGVYRLQANGLDRLRDSGRKVERIAPTDRPVLVLVHGTFVETSSTFGQLWTGHREGVERLFAQYAGAVHALDHPTLGASPIANARTLVDALPDGARLHLLTHSRGGLVAEVLARVAGAGGVDAADLGFFAAREDIAQQRELRALGAQVRAKGLRVDRVVRVACPARGTLLASKRLDAFVSVLKWTLEAAGLPIVPALVDFVGEVARRRADPALVPGLAAMIPGSPLLEWLNAAPRPVPGELRVVAGDLRPGDTLGSWLKALLADAYHWTDNDIVVHTRSMYGGAARRGGASFMLDQSAQATHFGYFANPATADAVVEALLDDHPRGFGPIGPLSWAGEDAGGARAAAGGPARRAPDPELPALFVLPGILGSHLRQGQPPERIWLGPRLIGAFERLAYQPGDADRVIADVPIGMVYDELIAHLDASHEVIPFGYDWRRPLEEEAARLAVRIEQALDARDGSRRPVRILAHSMGGLLARTLQLVAPRTWDRLLAHPGARLLMLGTPNGGSWAPMQVLSGDDTLGNLLATLGSPLADHRARQLMAEMPGLLQLQAGLLDAGLGLDRRDTWQRLADDDLRSTRERNWWHRHANEMVEPAFEWGVPTQRVLDQARALRLRLDAQIGGALAGLGDKLLLVVGKARFTPDGFELGREGFNYLDAEDGGDGRVTLASALLPGVPTWTLDCEHGDLPRTGAAFEAYAELLGQGRTARLGPLTPAARGRDAAAAAPKHVASRPSRRPASARPVASMADVLAGVTRQAQRVAPGARSALRVGVLNGNLDSVCQPLLLGHYRSAEFSGSEAAVDRRLGGRMRVALAADLYPEAPGEHRVFLNTCRDPSNPWQAPRPRAAIVIGLGDEGALTAAQIEASVCQGVKAWSQRTSEETPGHRPDIELAAPLIGSGGMGISPGTAARAIARGVWLANRRLAGTGWPTVAQLVLVEWYLDRATEAWLGLRVLAESNPCDYRLAPTIASGTSPLRQQPDSGYRGTDYDLISATTGADGSLNFVLNTRRARAELRAQHTQPALLRKLVERAATASSSDPRLGGTLFQLLVPAELKPFLSGTDRVLLQLDAGAAPIPWELLETEATDGAAPDRPWAIRSRLLRRLTTGVFRQAPLDAGSDAAVLVIGPPKVDDPRYPDLPGARREAAEVAALLGGPEGVGPAKLRSLPDGAEFDAIIVELMARPYRIVHMAGHGAPVSRGADGQPASGGGVVLSDGVFLGAAEIATLSVVPELVFVNCCHLGALDGAQTLALAEPVAFAAGVAETLIRIGVRCVVAAGWAVDDEPAQAFALALYRALLAGQSFIDAVAAARQAAYDAAPTSKTWAAYQCYGDPNWSFPRDAGDAQGVAASTRDEGDTIASAPGLCLTLETLAVRTRVDVAAGADARRRQAAAATLRGLQDRFGGPWGAIGAVAEAFGVAWEAAGDDDAALAWTQRAVLAADASASIGCIQRVARLRAQRAGALAAAVHPGDGAALRHAGDALHASLDELRALATGGPTVELLSLIGTGWKRLGLLESRAGDGRTSAAALDSAIEAYARAESLALARGDADLHEAALERMSLEVAVGTGRARWPGLDPADVERVGASLARRIDTDPDFSSQVGRVELEMLLRLGERRLAAHLDRLLAQFDDVASRVSISRFWVPVAERADFVLRRYASAAGAGERQAASRLLDRLQACARTAAPAPAPATAPVSRRRAAGYRPPVTSSTVPVV